MALRDRRPDFGTFLDAAPTVLPSDADQKTRKVGPDLFRLGKAAAALGLEVDAIAAGVVHRVPTTYDDSDLAAALATVPSGWTGLVAVKVAGS